MPVVIEGSKGVTGDAAKFKTVTVGIVGDRRNVSMSVATATKTVTADIGMHLLSNSLGDLILPPPATAVPLNLASQGAGGLAVGSKVTNSSFLGIYHIYNKTTGDQKMMAVDAHQTNLPQVCAPALLPQGYDYSALLTVVPTDASGNIMPTVLRDRKVATGLLGNVWQSSSWFPNGTVASVLDKVPRNAKTLDLIVLANADQTCSVQISVGAAAGTAKESRAGELSLRGGNISPSAGTMSIGVSTTGTIAVTNSFDLVIYSSNAGTAGTPATSSVMWCTGWEF